MTDDMSIMHRRKREHVQMKVLMEKGVSDTADHFQLNTGDLHIQMIIPEARVLRVVMIGDSSVGKTCIVERFIHSTFTPERQNTIASMYETYSEKRNDEEIQLQIWDTAGEEKFKSLGHIYYRDASGAVVVFDMTNRTSFQNVSEWIELFRSTAGDGPGICIVGNKVDRVDDIVISEKEAQEWAKSKGLAFFPTSAATGSGIKDVFSYMIDLLVTETGVQAMQGVRFQTNKPAPKPCRC